MMKKIKSSFIGNFTFGDNLAYNLDILSFLYEIFEDNKEEKKKLLYKPITILVVSIIEVILKDFFYRIAFGGKTMGVDGIDHKILQEIRSKKIEKFEVFIAISKKYDLLHKEKGFYDYLDLLRKLRNRIHIQNDKHHFEVNEVEAFTITRKDKAEKICEELFNIMLIYYDRGEKYFYVKDFELPW